MMNSFIFKTTTLVCFFSFFFNLIIAQETILKIGDYEKNSPKETFILNDPKTGNTAVFQVFSDYYSATLFDKDWNKLSKIKANRLPDKYKSIIGHQIKNNKYIFLLNSVSNKNYAIAFFDFNNNSAANYETKFKINRERYLTTISKGEVFYVLTTDKKESALNIYSFEKDYNNPNFKQILFPEATFMNDTERFDNFDEIFINDVALIEHNVPISIEEASKTTKIYLTESPKIKITSDLENKLTHVLEVDLSNGKYSFSSKLHSFFNEKALVKRSNSFIHKNLFFQFTSCDDGLFLQASDLESDEKLLSYKVGKKDDSILKSTPIYKETNTNSDIIEINNHKKLIRKLADSKVGVSVHSNESNYYVIVGGRGTTENNTLFVLGGGFLEGFISAAISSILNSYLEYNSSKSIRYGIVFDKNFKYVNDSVFPKNKFDLINEFSKDIKNPKATSLIELKENLIFGYFDRKSKTYILTSF